MKKRLLTLAVVASAVVSGSAMAAAAGSWVDGMATGTFSFGGEVTSKKPVVWQWKLGTDKTDFSADMSQLNEGKQDLTIIADEDIPILAAKLKNAVAGADFEQAGTFPIVSFASKDNTPITPKFSSNGGIALAINTYDDKNTKIGTLTVNGTVAGAIAMKTNDDRYILEALGGKAGGAFAGVIPMTNNWAVFGGENGASIAAKFGAPDSDEIETQVKDFVNEPSAQFTNIENNLWTTLRGTSDTTYKAYAYTYGLGVKQGNSLQLHFDKAIDATTQWSAPLIINVAYQ